MNKSREELKKEYAENVAKLEQFKCLVAVIVIFDYPLDIQEQVLRLSGR